MIAALVFRGFVMSWSRAGDQTIEDDDQPRTSAASPAAPTSFDAIFREHYAFVAASVRRLGIPDAAQDDAVQDVFLVVARRLAEFEGRSSLRTWLFAIAARVVQHHRRKSGRHQRKLEALAEATQLLARSDSLSRADAARLLRQLLETLDEGKRVVYVLIELEQLPAAEVAQMLELKVPTVHSRLRLARAGLRRAIEQLQQGGDDA